MGWRSRVLFVIGAAALSACGIIEAWMREDKPPRPRPRPAPVERAAPLSPREVQIEARELMRACEGGRFRGEQSTSRGDGWTMLSEDGQRFYQSFLNEQATALLPLGEHAVPELVYWLEHEQKHIRYIAHFALEQLTRIETRFPPFASLAELKAEGSLEKARAAYRDWYDQRP